MVHRSNTSYSKPIPAYQSAGLVDMVPALGLLGGHETA
jgi:hypothetical protein